MICFAHYDHSKNSEDTATAIRFFFGVLACPGDLLRIPPPSLYKIKVFHDGTSDVNTVEFNGKPIPLDTLLDTYLSEYSQVSSTIYIGMNFKRIFPEGSLIKTLIFIPQFHRRSRDVLGKTLTAHDTLPIILHENLLATQDHPVIQWPVSGFDRVLEAWPKSFERLRWFWSLEVRERTERESNKKVKVSGEKS